RGLVALTGTVSDRAVLDSRDQRLACLADRGIARAAHQPMVDRRLGIDSPGLGRGQGREAFSQGLLVAARVGLRLVGGVAVTAPALFSCTVLGMANGDPAVVLGAGLSTLGFGAHSSRCR